MNIKKTSLILILGVLLLLPGCNTKTDKDKAADNDIKTTVTTSGDNTQRFYRSLVLEFYNSKLLSNRTGYKEILFFKEKPYKSDYLILSHSYEGEGESYLDLFLITNKENGTKITKQANGYELSSMGVTINKLVHDKQTILFGVLRDSTWLIEEDKRKGFVHATIKVKFKDGKVVEEKAIRDRGYIIIADTTSEIEDVIFYDSEGQEELSFKNLEKYGKTFDETAFEEVK